MAKSQCIILARGRIDIQETPEEFPLGARGTRPVCFSLSNSDDIKAVKSLSIPGVLVQGMRIKCAWDAAPIVASAIGEPNALDQALADRLSCRVPLPGKERYDALGLHKARRDYQGEGIRFLLRRAYALLGHPPRAGKCLMVLSVSTLIEAKKVLIICNSLGKYVWAEEIAKWLGEECVLLFGRAGTEVRTFCKVCMGRGSIVSTDASDEVHETQCKACRVRGRSRGEHIYTARTLVQDTEEREWVDAPSEESMARYQLKLQEWRDKTETKLAEFERKEKERFEAWEKKNPKRRKPFEPKTAPEPSAPPEEPKGRKRTERIPIEGSFRCPKHKDEVDSYARPCHKCKAELYKVVDSRRFVIVNYDILAAQKDKDDEGASFIRSDLQGWAPILARYHFDMAVADESHKLRGWQNKGPGAKDATTQRERVNEVCAEIPRVYAVTGTPVYGFTRDLWGQLDFISKGLWS